jgi:hypothetical protein
MVATNAVAGHGDGGRRARGNGFAAAKHTAEQLANHERGRLAIGGLLREAAMIAQTPLVAQIYGIRDTAFR